MKRFIALLLVTVLLLASCNTDPPADTDVVTDRADTASAATETPTTEHTEPAVTDDLSSDPPVLADGFAFAAAYKEAATENSGSSRYLLR